MNKEKKPTAPGSTGAVVRLQFQNKHPIEIGTYLQLSKCGMITSMEITQKDLDFDAKERYWLEGFWLKCEIVT